MENMYINIENFEKIYTICVNKLGLALVIFLLMEITCRSNEIDKDNFFKFHTEPLCANKSEYYMEDDGEASTMFLDFRRRYVFAPETPCTRILSTKQNLGFIVQLVTPKFKYLTDKNKSDRKYKVENATTSFGGRSCPINVFSSLEPLTSQWQIDPCELEDKRGKVDDPVRIFQGRIFIVWNHHLNQLNSKLMITVLAKGEHCRNERKHNCLAIGNEPILCISKDLVCDGIRQCPPNKQYTSDEDSFACWEQYDSNSDYKKDIIKNLIQSIFNENVNGTINLTGSKMNSDKSKNEIIFTKEAEKNVKHAISNSKFKSNIFSYGIWGYSLLGIIVFGGALLICSFLASASQNRTSELTENNVNSTIQVNMQSERVNEPPSYYDLDSPPPYTVLFPKGNTNSNLNATGTSAMESGM